MTEQSLKERGFIIKTSLVDFPGTVSTVFFIRGCNLRCPYCYNTSLVDLTEDKDLVSVKSLMVHLARRQGVLKAFVLSGGEALLNKATREILEEAGRLGYRLKLDTNGTVPERLEELLKTVSLDYVALDLKTSFKKYPLLHYKNNVEDPIHKTLTLLQEHHIPFEVRTVLVPGLVTKEDLESIGSLIPEENEWYLAQFMNNKCLDPSYENLMPYTQKELEELLESARGCHSKVSLR